MSKYLYNGVHTPNKYVKNSDNMRIIILKCLYNGVHTPNNLTYKKKIG